MELTEGRAEKDVKALFFSLNSQEEQPQLKGYTKNLVILLSLTLFIMTDFANFLRELLGISD